MAMLRVGRVLVVMIPAGLSVLPAQTGDAAAAAATDLRKAPSLDDEAIGYAGIKSAAYRAYERLRDAATAAELIVWVGDDSPMLRCYAFRALVEKHPDVALGPLLLPQLGDRSKVTTMRGCMRAERYATDVLLELAAPVLPVADQRALHARLVRDETAPALDARGRALRSEKFAKDLLPVIERLARGGDDEALIALMRYGRPADLALLRERLQADRGLKELHFVLWAAEVRPDPALMPLLAAIAPKAHRQLRRDTGHRMRQWFAAVAAQRSEAAAATLRAFVRDTDASESRQRSMRTCLRKVLEKHAGVAVYDELRRSLE